MSFRCFVCVTIDGIKGTVRARWIVSLMAKVRKIEVAKVRSATYAWMPQDGRRLATPPGESTTCEASQSKLMQDEFGNLHWWKYVCEHLQWVMLAAVALYKVDVDVFEVNDTFPTQLLPTSETWSHMLVDLVDPLSFGIRYTKRDIAFYFNSF